MKERTFFEVARNDYQFLITASILILWLGGAFLAPWLVPQNPYDLTSFDILDSELPPAWIEGGTRQFLFGTDPQGRDILSTVFYGMRLSLIISISAVMIQLMLGTFLGLMAGYLGGRWDSFIMRTADVQLSLSTLMLTIITLAIIKNFFAQEVYDRLAIYMIIMVIGVAEWPQYARVVRSGVLVEREKEYVAAARVVGVSPRIILFKHIFPNLISPLLVIATVQVANAIISEAALSFLGLGMPPTQPSLGLLISRGFEYIFSGAWWITFIPSFFLVVLIVTINILGGWFEDYFNPKLYK
ncbi:ABC transporter permease [Spirochaetota bacterium]|nr:ABC transporter permease [Spirochaetota bacterium]